MLVNGIKYHNHAEGANFLNLVLGGTVDQALAMDTSRIQFITDEGDLAEEFFGFVKKSATVDAATGRVTLHCVLDPSGSGAAVNALGAELKDVKAKNDDTQAVLAALLGGE
ncbi:MAG: hypothetical protein IJO87_10500 [Eggerthellaceae bacterium]|nr:hypothetical protein [Eggerthellaceae bacterium]